MTTSATLTNFNGRGGFLEVVDADDRDEQRADACPDRIGNPDFDGAEGPASPKSARRYETSIGGM